MHILQKKEAWIISTDIHKRKAVKIRVRSLTKLCVTFTPWLAMFSVVFFGALLVRTACYNKNNSLVYNRIYKQVINQCVKNDINKNKKHWLKWKQIKVKYVTVRSSNFIACYLFSVLWWLIQVPI